MKVLILSHFDYLYGPRILFKAPQSLEDPDLKKIPALMDLYENGFFVHIFGKFKSANYIFELDSKYARGEKEILLLSFLVDINGDINLDLANELLEQFSNEIKKISNIYKAFYINSEIHEGDKLKYNQLNKLFQSFYESFPVENIVIKRKPAKIFVFGLHKAGKTTIIQQLKHSITKDVLPTTNVNILRVNFNDLSILVYDCPGQTKFHDLWMPYLKHQNGLVFVIDIHDDKNYATAKRVLHEIADHPEVSELPLLILFNKIDLGEVELEFINSKLELEKLRDRPLNYFFTSGLKDIKIEEAFNWIANEVSDTIGNIPERDLGLIFSKWNETEGLEVISVFPRKTFQDPEVIAIRCFSISQFVFGGKDFQRAFVILPFTHMRANAAIYFDFMPDPNVRGGKLPFSLILFFDEKIPRTVINQLKLSIFEELTSLKKSYLDKRKIQKSLKGMHKKVLDKLNSLKSTVDALRLAELRYQTLFKAARDAIIIIDKKSGVIVDANNQAEEMLEIFPEDLIGMPSSLLLLKKQENFLDQIMKQVNIEKSPPIEMELISTSGKSIPVEANANSIQMGGQNMIQCIFRDITERKNTQRKLKASETKFRYLFEKSPFSIILINQKGVIIDLNPATLELLGYNKGELIGENYVKLDAIKKQDLKNITKHMRKVIGGKNEKPIRVQITKKNEKKIWIELHTTLMHINKSNYLQIIAQDVTEQMEAEEIIRKRLKFEKIIANISSKFVVINDLEKVINESLKDIGIFSQCDRSYLILFDENGIFMKNTNEWCAKGIISEKDNLQFILVDNFPWWLKKLHQDEFVHIADISKLPEKAKATKDLLESKNVSSVLAFPVYIEGKLSGYLGLEKKEKIDSWDDESFALLGMFSEFLGNELSRVKAEEALQISKERFHQAYDKANFYKELFAHDMNQILNNINSAISMFKNREDDLIKKSQKDIEMMELLEIIKSQAKGGMNLISNIQKLSQIEESELKIKPIKLIEILRDLVSKIKNQFPEKTFNIKIEPKSEYYVLANEILTDVFQNIIVIDLRKNPNSSIEMKISISKEELRDQKYITIKFIDNKVNFNKKEHKEIQKDNRGILIRLTLIDKVIMSFKGSFWVENDNFVISLPTPF